MIFPGSGTSTDTSTVLISSTAETTTIQISTHPESTRERMPPTSLPVTSEEPGDVSSADTLSSTGAVYSHTSEYTDTTERK